jgi:hypothetical protein
LSVLSDFETLEIRAGDTWCEASNGDDAYYVCAKFANGHHVPLPVLLEWDAPAMQAFAIRLAEKLNPDSFLAAVNACEEFDPDFTKNFLGIYDQ